MKEINCTFMMGGTYYLEERSVCAAREKAMVNLPLPEDRDYIDDSLTVDDLAECMVANGWGEDVVEELSSLTPEALIQMLDERYQQGLEVAPGTPYTTTQLREFLLDYYDIDHPNAKDTEPQSEQRSFSAKECFIVVYSNYADTTSAYAFESKEDAERNIEKDAKATELALIQQGYQPKTRVSLDGAEVYVPCSRIYYEWKLIESTIRSQAESVFSAE